MICNTCAGNKVLHKLWFLFYNSENVVVNNNNNNNHTIACPEDASEGGGSSKLQRVTVDILNGQLRVSKMGGPAVGGLTRQQTLHRFQ
jgi:hypothetical protein